MVLSDFARTMLTDFPIQALLDELVGRIVEIPPAESCARSRPANMLARSVDPTATPATAWTGGSAATGPGASTH